MAALIRHPGLSMLAMLISVSPPYQVFNIAFDASIHETMATLVYGVCVCIVLLITFSMTLAPSVPRVLSTFRITTSYSPSGPWEKYSAKGLV
jgi:hypothetical protein